MEKYKIYRRDNYIEIAPLNGKYIFTGHVKEVKVVREVPNFSNECPGT